MLATRNRGDRHAVIGEVRRCRTYMAKVRRRENGPEVNGWIKLLLPITNPNPKR